MKVPTEHKIQQDINGRIKTSINPGLHYLMESLGKEEVMANKDLLIGGRIAFLWGMHEGMYRSKKTKTGKLNSASKGLVNGIYSEIDGFYKDLRDREEGEPTHVENTTQDYGEEE